MSEHSLVRRAILGIISAEFAFIAVLATTSIAHERSVRLRAVDVMLQGRADSLFGAVQDAEDAGDNVMLDTREIVLPGGDAYAVYDMHGTLLGSSPNALPDLISDTGVGIRDRQAHGRRYRVLERRYMRVIDRAETGGAGMERPVLIMYATPMDRIWREIFNAVRFYLVASLLLVVGTTIFVVLLLRRLLFPLQELAAATAALSPRELTFRAPPSALQVQELQPLANTLSSLIEDLRTAFERQHRFVGDAAHELKTAVAVVRSSLQLLLLRRRSVQEYEAGLLGAVEDNARVEGLVSRMLLMARLEETPVSQTLGSDLVDNAAHCLRDLLSIAERKGVGLVATFFGMPHPILRSNMPETDRPQHHLVPVSAEDLHVLLSNLVLNAIEHSLPGSIVHLDLTAEHANVVLRIRDTGEGISETDLLHIFERFYRADSSRARTTGGAGLGLPISKAIVDRARGEIWLDSRPGQGTTVYVVLPPVVASRISTFSSP